MRALLLRLAALLAFALLAIPAFADTWTVTRLRGEVAAHLSGSKWEQLKRGSTVSDDRLIRTGNDGHVSFVRGTETIDLGPNTQIQIFDKGGSKPFTMVQQHFGTVAIEADVRNVQHFAVRNQYLAAVVKGTKFMVTSEKDGVFVQVNRGEVAVEDMSEHSTTFVRHGQMAAVQKGAHMMVSGRGKLSPVLSKSGDQLLPPSGLGKAVDKALSKLEAAKASGDPKAIKRAEDELQKAIEKTSEDAEKAAKKAAEKIAKSEDDKHHKGKSDDDDDGRMKAGKREDN